jgi:hypothetical protein
MTSRDFMLAKLLMPATSRLSSAHRNLFTMHEEETNDISADDSIMKNSFSTCRQHISRLKNPIHFPVDNVFIKVVVRALLRIDMEHLSMAISDTS